MSLKALFSDFFSLIFLSITFSYSLKNLCNYADDNTLFAFGKTFAEVTRKLQNDFLILDEWFFNNFLVLNSDKCHFMTLGTSNTLPNFKCKNITKKNKDSKKLLGVISITNLTLRNTLIQYVKSQTWSYMFQTESPDFCLQRSMY